MTFRKRPALFLALPVLAGALLLPAAPAGSQCQNRLSPQMARVAAFQQAQRAPMLAPAQFAQYGFVESPDCSPSRGMLMLQQARQQNAQFAVALQQAQQQNAELARALDEQRKENARLTAIVEQHSQRKALVTSQEQQQIRQLTLALDQEKRQTAVLRATLYQNYNNQRERQLAGAR